MKNHPFVFAACALLFFCGCTKDSESLPFENRNASERLSAAPGALLCATSESSENEVPCDSIPFGANFVSIRYHLVETGISPPHCFTEAELSNVLLDAGVPAAQVKTYMQDLFYRDKTSTPQLAHEIAAKLNAGFALPFDYMPDCFSINAICRSDYPGDFTNKIGCHPGFIDQYTVRQSKACDGYQSIIEAGFSGLRLKKKSTNEIVTIPFSSSLNDLYEPLIASGLTPDQAVEVAQKIMLGKYTIREVWNLFQFRIAPNMTLVQELCLEEGSDWEIWHVGIGIFSGDGSILSFYFAQGAAFPCFPPIGPTYADFL
jgi:hypothetical protein